MIRSFGVGALAVGIANAFAELVVYGAFLIPRFGSLAEIPLGWFALMYAPVLVACVFAASRATSWRDAVSGAFGASMLAQVEKLLLALVGASGHEASAASVAPVHFWTVHFARMTFGFVVLFLLAYAATAAWARRATAPSHPVR